MRRFVLFAVLCTLSLPVGLSITGCNHDYGQNFCSGFQSGPLTTATASITLQPATYGLSVSYGQIASVSNPTALTCKNLPSGLSKFTYGTTNLNLADVSPSGQVCGGMWNRNSGNNIPNFTTCIPPLPGSAIYAAGGGIAYITASGGGATSNPVPVFVHPPVTSIVLGGKNAVHSCPNNPTTGGPTDVGVYNPESCVSQNLTAQLAATVCTGTGTCTPNSSNDITCDAGHLTFAPQNSNILTIDQNGVATAHQPGSTVISATVAQATSTAGYFFTCPPKSIQLRVGNTNNTSVTVNTNNTQPLTATVLDTENNPITGLALTYTSTDPVDIPVSSTGAVTPAYPSDAAIVAQCLPSVSTATGALTCNPAPQDQIANLSTGLPVTSNPVEVHTPGPSSNILYMSSPSSYNFVPVDFQSGTVGTPIRLPYQPNSMVMDEDGNNLYFGSSTELMIASITPTNGTALTTQVPGVPGTVLAVSPDDSLVVVHDPCRQLFYLYTPAVGKVGATEMSFAAPGPTIACNVDNQPIDPSVEVHPPYSAAFTQDAQTVYIVGGNVLYTYSTFTGWHTCTDNAQTGNCPIDSKGVAVTVPGVGAFAGGSSTTAFGYCALGPNNTGQVPGPPPVGVNPDTAVNPVAYYPSALATGTTLPPTDQLMATTDGNHVIGATASSGGNLTDIEVTIPEQACPLKTALTFPSTPTTISLGVSNVASIDQVLTSPNSDLGFVTYTPTSATGGNTLPAYQIPCTNTQISAGTCPAGQATTGKIVDVPLTGNAGSPIGGVFSPDTNTFYVSTSGDDLVHFISTANINALTDTQQINPGLTCGTTTTAPANPSLACNAGQPVPVLFLASRPRPSQGTTSSAAKN
ncbi:MAG: hypothetical protein WA708_00625 [Acidobacteriaceae bacterium]